MINRNFNYCLVFLILFLETSVLFSQNGKPYFDCPCPQIIAHQGSSLELPPNTVEAFELALNQGADIIELDIWLTKDEEWVVVHDENLLKITGINKNVGELTLLEMNFLDAGYGFYKNNTERTNLSVKQYKIPSLEKIFQTFSGERINIEIKDSKLSGLVSLIDLINEYKMSDNIPGLVETSNNLANISLNDGNLNINCLTRSSDESSKEELKNIIKSLFINKGYTVDFSGDYPGWQPNMSSEILAKLVKVYKDLNSTEPNVAACHAGLECGIIGSHYPKLDMISFGPTIRGAHSPDERASIKSTIKFWRFLKEVLLNIPLK